MTATSSSKTAAPRGGLMATPAADLPTLGSQTRAEVGDELQAMLVELVDLSLLGKQLHWSVVGPGFRPLHEQLDEFVDVWRELADTVAERAVAVGAWPDGQRGALVAGSPVVMVECGALVDQGVVHALTHCLQDISERARGRMDRLGYVDTASQDVITDVVRELEKQLWMLCAQVSAPHEHASETDPSMGELAPEMTGRDR